MQPMSRRTKKAVRWLFAFAVVAAMLYVGWWSLCEFVFHASIGYEVEAEFAELPPDDAALEAWLKQQPGVLIVEVTRIESRKAIRIFLLMGQNLHYKPPVPNLEQACAELGYRGQRDRFRDTEPRPNR